MRSASGLRSYVEGLIIGQGRHAGQPFTVLPWQARFLRGAFRQTTGDVGLSLGRGGGKTTLIAALGAATVDVDGPLVEPQAENVIVASSFDQALIAFRHVLHFLRPTFEAHKRRFRVQDSANRATITDRETGAMLRVLGSDPARAHGLAPRLIIGDELAQWPIQKVDPMLAALRTSLGKIPDSRAVWIGTRPATPTHPFSRILAGDLGYRQVHAAPKDAPPFHRRTWLRANPGLAHLPDLEAEIRKEAAEARQDPAALQTFRALRLNQGVADHLENLLLDADTWEGIEGVAERTGRCTWGVDLGTTAAMSAVSAYWPETGRLDSLCAFPRVPDLRERGLRDGVGGLYVEGFNADELIVAGDNAVDVAALVREARSRFGQPSAVAADRWREGELRDAMKAAGVRVPLQLRGQGFRDGADDVRRFRRAVAEGHVVPFPSLILTSAMSEARTVTDPAGNQKLSKGTEGGRRLRARDDAAAAAILAVSLGVRRKRRGSGGAYLGMSG